MDGLDDGVTAKSSAAPSGSLAQSSTICHAKHSARPGLIYTVEDGCGCFGLQSKPQKRSEGSGPSDQSRTHRCILSFKTLELIYSWQQLEPLLLEYNWTPGFLDAGWVEYHYHAVEMGNVVFKSIRVPERMEGARKSDLLKLVRTVNRMAQENVLCAWVQREPPPLGRLQRCLSVVKGYQSCSSTKAYAAAQLALEGPVPEPSEKSSSPNAVPVLLALEAPALESFHKPSSSSSRAPVLALEAPAPESYEKFSFSCWAPVLALKATVLESSGKSSTSESGTSAS
ncbi:hypothetical protein R1flu_011502 [Riccia fluitans]|uniref:Uncharacterized protein n=1 Tax=Riccia fluitans TaxID=41844 RepID=A0ABD1Z870_9MARC